jgi:3-oxoacyl-[acyl-carrier-protein] synthase III
MVYSSPIDRIAARNRFRLSFNHPKFMSELSNRTETPLRHPARTPMTHPARTESGRSRCGGAIPFVIQGTGSYVPDRIVSNDDLAHLGCDSEWIIQRTGIRERRWAAVEQATSDLAYEAAIRCLRQAAVDPSDVDLIVVATITQDHMTPSTACLLQQRLGCIAPAMDINAACSGFMYALVTGGQFVRNGLARNALIVGSEVMSRTVNPADPKTLPLFGDGAGAVLLQSAPALEINRMARESEATAASGFDPASDANPGPASDAHPGIVAFTLGSEGMLDALCIPAGGSREPLTAPGIDSGRQYMQMDGRSVFKWAVRCVADSCRDVLIASGLEVDDVDWVVLHQANVRIIEAALADFGLPPDRVIKNLDRFGNTSAASIPLALDEAHRDGRLQRGDLVLMCGFGAGLTWGTALVRW